MSSQQHRAQELAQFLSRADVRRIVYFVNLRRLLELSDRRQRWQHDEDNSVPIDERRLTKSEHSLAQQQARLIENVLYMKARCLEDYQDLSTIQERVTKARRAVCIKLQQRAMMERGDGRA